MAYITHTELISSHLNAFKQIEWTAVLKDLINEDVNSFEKQQMYQGKQYYRNQNEEIVKRKFYLFGNVDDFERTNNTSTNIEDLTRANNKIPSGFLTTLIKQKVNYILGNPVTFDEKNKDIKKKFPGNFDKFIKQGSTKASQSSVVWAHFYVDGNGDKKVCLIEGIECIPIWDINYEQELIQMIRYYKIPYIDEKGCRHDLYKVEVWDKQQVTYYMQDIEGSFYLDTTIENNPAAHYNLQFSLGDKTDVRPSGFNQVPFVPLWNNDERLNDLVPVKAYIDAYDICQSDFANNIEDFQEIIYMLKNFGGQDYDEFVKILKKYKCINVDDDGEVKVLSGEIPTEARDRLLNIFETKIYEFGMGLNPNKLGDGNITNVVIKARYEPLNLKSSETITEINDFIQQLYKFMNDVGWYKNDWQSIEPTYTKSAIFNESEKIVDINNSLASGTISMETAMRNHPYIGDIEKEKQLKDKEKKDKMNEIDELDFEEEEGDDDDQD